MRLRAVAQAAESHGPGLQPQVSVWGKNGALSVPGTEQGSCLDGALAATMEEPAGRGVSSSEGSFP
jgi:hypothetical protein